MHHLRTAGCEQRVGVRIQRGHGTAGSNPSLAAWEPYTIALLLKRPIGRRINQAPVPLGHFQHRRSHPMAFVRHHASLRAHAEWPVT
jgi:hypothetical protein